MYVARKIAELRKLLCDEKKKGKSIGFVPTMGYLHEGHLELVRHSKKDNDITVVSIFVNPIQFGPNEDLRSYPRDEASDLKKLEASGVDYAFLPTVDEMYPEELLTFVQVDRLSEPMCGAFRPGHFRGVATVVAKLFNIVQPDRAYFGMKDYQQLKVIEKMVKDLNFPVQIVAVQTVREANGLAMSSRNSYLSEEERKQASSIYRALLKGKELYEAGVRDAEAIKNAVYDELSKVPTIKVQYVELRDAETLEDIKRVEKPAVLALAVFLGKARLIDNIIIG
ncbi:MAG: pantoate--beta-alanine ligase [Actinobacteria bacterium]|nr:pantoate--beta-alanine ligase [Actinomycetota bacterium]